MARIAQLFLWGVPGFLWVASGCSQDPVETDESSSDGGSSRPNSSGGVASSSGGTSSGGLSAEGGLGGREQGDAPPRRDFPNGDPGCGLEAAAFCDTFDDVASDGLGEGRVGDLDSRLYSGARADVSNYGDEAWAVRFAKTPTCRPGLPDQVGPGQDFLVCDGNDRIQSRHMMMIAAEQNYGQAGVRIRQPFDFFEREGRIVFDAEASHLGPLHGWLSVSITEDPSPAPSFATINNFENGAIPRSGLEIHFFGGCHVEGKVAVSQVHVFDDFVDHFFEGPEDVCVSTEAGALNHFEIRASKSRIEIYVSDSSPDGVEFGELTLLYATDVDLPFDRGYVHLSTHNHATLKYSDGQIDSWITRWDNIAFDGPIVSDRREYSIPDSLEIVEVTERLIDETFVTTERTNVGYQLNDIEDGAAQVFRFSDVDITDVTRAHVALNVHLLMNWDLPNEEYLLRYRINDGAWATRGWSEGQLGLLEGPYVYNEAGENVRELGEGTAGRFSMLLELDPEELRDGENTLEIATEKIPRSYPPIAANIDLVLTTD